MPNRMDKYDGNDNIPKRSEKNKELYKQIYNAYDEFENLVVPSNTREIDPSELKKEVTSRDEYRKVMEYGTITNNKVKRKEIVREVQKKENEIYDINELLDKAVSTSKKDDEVVSTLSSGDYLKKLKMNEVKKTNLEKVKEMYEDISNDSSLEDDSLLQTANLSLEILSDLKGDNDNTIVDGQLVSEDDSSEDDFYSNKYKFSKRDFEDKSDDNLESKKSKKEEKKSKLDKKVKSEKETSFEDDDIDVIKEESIKKEEKEEDLVIASEEDDNDEEDDDEDEGIGHTFLKTFFLIFGILLVAAVVIYLFYYFGKI